MFDVYVEGPREPGETAVEQLARGMAKHYGLPFDQLLGRLSQGRFRVKTGVDRATAETYLRDLAALGADCSVEASTGARTPPVGVPTPPSPSPAPAPPAASASTSLPAMPRTNTTSTPPATLPAVSRTSTPPAGTYQSGLAAAFSVEAQGQAAADLGALGGDKFSLASLDGEDGATVDHTGSYGPPPEPPPIAPPTIRTPRTKTPVPMPLATPPPAALAAVDPFAPPDAERAELKVQLAPDEIERRERKRVSLPPENEPVAPAPAQLPAAAPPVAIARPRNKLGPLADERVRFAAGVAIAILLGFLPAHAIASMREHSAYQRIDERIEEAQAHVDNLDDYNALDKLRDRELANKRSERTSAALLGLALWAVSGSAIAYAWFKKVPWDRFDVPPPPAIG